MDGRGGDGVSPDDGRVGRDEGVGRLRFLEAREISRGDSREGIVVVTIHDARCARGRMTYCSAQVTEVGEHLRKLEALHSARGLVV